MKTIVLRFATILGCLLAIQAQAQTREAEVVETFSSLCTKLLPDFSSIESQASKLGLHVLKENYPNMGEGRSSKFKVWQVPSAAGTYVLIASEFSTKENTFTTCRVSAANANGQETRNTLISKLNLPLPEGERLVSKDLKDKQITWNTSLHGEGVQIVLLHPNSDGPGMDLSVIRKLQDKPALARTPQESTQPGIIDESQKITLTAVDLGLIKHFAKATATLMQRSPVEYEARFNLGEMTSPRSGQDFMLVPFAQALLIHCTAWRLAAKAGHNAVIFRMPKGQKPNGLIKAHLTLVTLPVSEQKPSSTEDVAVLDLTTKEFQSTRTRLCERSIQELNEKPW